MWLGSPCRPALSKPEDSPLRPCSEGKRHLGRHAALAALAAVLALSLAACETATGTFSSRTERVEIEPAPAPQDRGAQPRPQPEAATPAPATAAPGPGTETAALPPAGTGEGRVVLTPPPGVKPMIKVAILLPLSGAHAKLGQGMLNAAQLALFSMAGDEMALLPIDTQGTPEGAARAAEKAVFEGARLILGPVFSASVAAVAPVARARGVQVISFSNNRTVAGNGVYVMGLAPEAQVRRVMSYARERGLRRVLALVPEGPYGDVVAGTLQSVMPELGLELAGLARYGATTTEALSPLVRRIANYGPRHAALLKRRKELEAEGTEAAKRELRQLENRDTLGDVDFDAVFLPQGGAGLLALAPLLRFYDVDPRKVRVLGTADWNDPALATEPALFGGWFAAPPPAARTGFETAYKSAFGGPPLTVASLAYDATALAAVLVRGWSPPRVAAAGGAGPAAVPPAPPGAEVFSAAALTSPSGFAGADGIFRLLPSGPVERGYAVMEVRERRFTVVSPAPRTFQKLQN